MEDTFVARRREAIRKNTEGISFTLRLEEDKLQFKPGEIIRVEFSFTSDLPNTYDLDGATYERGGRLGLDKYFLDHKNGVVDPLRDYPPGGIGGGIRSDSTLSERPHKMTFDLNECNSLSSLKMKLGQFPKNTTFIWSPYNQDPSAAERVFSELKTFLEAKGMKLEKRKDQ